MARTGFENLRVYRLAEELADLEWVVVSKWERLAKDTVGKQLMKRLGICTTYWNHSASNGSHLCHPYACPPSGRRGMVE